MSDASLEPLWRDNRPPDLGAVLAEMLRPLSWMSEAECGRTLPDGSYVHDPEDWHPEKGGSVEKARKVCLGCAVRVPCLDYAMATKQQFGVWGGKSVMERRAMRRGGDQDGEA